MAETSPSPIISRNLLSIEVATFIRREILSGNLRPGDHLVEANFAQRLQISKSPVREAFRLLEAEGLVISYPHRGSYVAKLDPRDTWELDTLRAVLEPFAAQLAVEKLDDERICQLEDLVRAMGSAADQVALSELHANFHKTVIHGSGHKRIVEILDGLWSQMNLLLTVTHFGHLEQSTVQHNHQLLLDALKERDGARVRRLFEEHISRTLPGLMESLDEELQPGASVAPAHETNPPRGRD